MKILITGGAGFIGSHIADACIAAGHDVVVLDNFTTGREININPRAVVYRADIRDRDEVNRIFAENRFDLVNHHAAQLDVRLSVADPQFDAAQNIIGTLNLLEACVATDVRRFVFASTGGAVYGEQEYFPADELHPTNPMSPYGVTKLSVEKYLGYYRQVHGIEHVIFRYTNVFGPRQNPHGEAGVIAIFFDKMFRGEQPTIHGSGEQTRDYVYVGDLVRAHMSALDYLDHVGSNIFNLSTGTETSVNELFGVLNRMFDGRFEEQHGPAKPGEQLRSVCSFERARRELGWAPRVDLPSGLEETLAYYRS